MGLSLSGFSKTLIQHYSNCKKVYLVYFFQQQYNKKSANLNVNNRAKYIQSEPNLSAQLTAERTTATHAYKKLIQEAMQTQTRIMAFD
jgi:hypothetical protein